MVGAFTRSSMLTRRDAQADRAERDNPLVRFAPKHPQNVRQAIGRLRLDEGLSGPETVRKLAAGEVEGVDPVEVPAATVYYIAGDYTRSLADCDVDLRDPAPLQLVSERDQALAPVHVGVVHDAVAATRPAGEGVEERKLPRRRCHAFHRLERDRKKGGVDPVGFQRFTGSLANLIRVQPPMPRVEAPEPNKPEPKLSPTLEERLARAQEQQGSAEAAKQVPVEPQQKGQEEVAKPRRSLAELRQDTSPEGRRAYEARLREIGFKDEALSIMLQHQQG